MPSEADITGVDGSEGYVADRTLAPRRIDRTRLPALVLPIGLIGLDLALGGGVLFILAVGPDRDAPLTGAGALFLALSLRGLAWRGLYDPGRYRTVGGPAVGPQVARAAAAIVGAFATTMLALALLAPNWPGHAGAIAANLFLAGLTMLLGRMLFVALLRAGLGARLAARAVVIGDGAGVAALMAATRQGGGPAAGYPRLIGWLDGAVGPPVPGLPSLGPIARLGELARSGRVDQVILVLPVPADHGTGDLIRHLAAFPVDIRIAPDPSLAHGDQDLIHVLDRPGSGWGGLAKRAEDVAVGTILLLAFALPMLLVALAVRLDSPGPAWFRQRRVGLNNQSFEMLKFRTMRLRDTPAEPLSQATRDDPRLTRLGAFLRRTSLDELPQLFNVLRGDMALVGPRPHAPGTAANGRRFEAIVPFYAGRHRVKPGITGLAQVRGLRGETRTEDAVRARVDADFEYIQRWSVGLDLIILLRTAICVLTMRNAY